MSPQGAEALLLHHFSGGSRGERRSLQGERRGCQVESVVPGERLGLEVINVYKRPGSEVALCCSVGSIVNFRGDAIVNVANGKPQLTALCGIKPDQTEANFTNNDLKVGDAIFLAFDLKKNTVLVSLKCVLAFPTVSCR